MLRLMRFHEFALQRLTLVTVRNCRSCTSLSATQAMPDCITLFVNRIYRFRAKSEHMKSKPNVLLRRLSSKTPRFLKHSTPTQLTTDSGATPRDGELKCEVSDDGSPAPNCDSPVPMLRRSTRQRRPPDRYGEWTV